MEKPDWMEDYLKEEDEEGYVPFNKDRRLGQNQYVSRYAKGILNDPDLGEGLRWKGLDESYHDIKIHKDDLLSFHKRVEAYKKDVSWGQAQTAQHYNSMQGY